jgi:hypothetical protein
MQIHRRIPLYMTLFFTLEVTHESTKGDDFSSILILILILVRWSLLQKYVGRSYKRAS